MEDERLYYCVYDEDIKVMIDIFHSKKDAEKFIKACTEFSKVYKKKINYSIKTKTRDAL